MSRQREHDFGYGDKGDGKRDNGNGDYVTNHSVSNLFRQDGGKRRVGMTRAFISPSKSQERQ
jgi:hypothetical protein